MTNAVVRLGPLTFVPAVLREFGCKPEPIIDSAGLTVAQFENPDVKVPYVVASKLLARCAKATGCEHFGLLLGQQVGGSYLGVAGHMSRFAPDVGTALRDLVNHLDLHDRGGVATLATDGKMTLLGYAIHQDKVEASAQIYDLAITIACNIMRELCGEYWHPTEVLLTRRQPGDVTPYQQFFQALLRFDADRSALVFPTHWLDQRLSGSDPLLRRYLMNEAAKLRTLHAVGLLEELHQELHKSLLSQRCTLAEVARQLGMHERTLSRRLQAEGTTFQHEREQVRHTMARHFLAETWMTLDEIATALGYADASAFSHAFRRWTEVAPMQWRAANTRR